MEVADGIAKSNKTFSLTEKKNETKSELFKKLPLYTIMLVKQILDMFVRVLESYYGSQNNRYVLVKYQVLLQHELKSLGVVQNVLTATNDPSADGFAVLTDTIDFLTSVYTTYRAHQYKIPSKALEWTITTV